MGRIKRNKHGPEWYIQKALIEFLRVRGWLVEPTHGSAYQTGFPDLYCRHADWGERWIDAKNPATYTFTRAQKHKWPLWDHFKAPIYILTAATQEEYDKLFGPPNWRDYWKPAWGKVPNVDVLLDELVAEYERSRTPNV